VKAQPEPAGFDASVRRPGKRFLATLPGGTTTVTNEKFKGQNHWKSAAKELYEAYGHICAYSCMYIPTTTGTIDHFQPKTRRPDLAYEWSNFRLAIHKMNSNKGDRTDILDPFTVGPGWFVLDVPSCLLRPGDGLTPEQKQSVETTISALKLNDDDILVQERCDIMLDFAKGDVKMPHLQKRYPLLAAEIVRQGIEQTAPQIFKTFV
jgi:hypothetical protein